MHKQGGNDLLHRGTSYQGNINLWAYASFIQLCMQENDSKKMASVMIQSFILLFHEAIQPHYCTWRSCRYVFHCAQACLMSGSNTSCARKT